jgi:hypothetical protein
MERARDHAFEALAEATSTDMQTGRGELNRALKLIRDQADADADLPSLIRQRASQYRRLMPDAILTPTALAKHWHRVDAEAERPTVGRTNQQAAPTDCATCGGDRFVVYQTRPAQQSAWMREKGIVPKGEIEEYAACPDCNADTDVSYWLMGRKVTPPDPAQVRARLT